MLTTQEKISFLYNVSAFKGLSDQQLGALAGLCTECSFAQGEYLFRQGDISGVLHVVVSGRVVIEREIDLKSDTISIMMAKPYDHLGEMSLFYDAPRSVSAMAIEDTVTLQMENDHFSEFILQYPKLLIEFCRVLSVRLCEAYDKISEVTLDRKPRELRKLYDKLDF